jgi:hypothetical protein
MTDDKTATLPQGDTQSADAKKDGKGKKRALFGLGKKSGSTSPSAAVAEVAPPSLPTETSKASTTRSTARSIVSPNHSDHRRALASSPQRGVSSSPRMSSPARSQIFERDVDSGILKPSSPAIPGHIQTENHIPPVLNEASDAIVDKNLDPDSVEIVTHASHQPASAAVTGAHGATPYEQAPSDWTDQLANLDESQIASFENASHYGSLDAADVKRLSFISFADVVQSEHPAMAGPGGSRESVNIGGLTSLQSVAMNRSPSPIRSPVSSQGGPGTSPPTSNPGSFVGVEMSPPRKPMGSPGSTQNLASSGDLNIETMSQALRRTGSRDFNSVRSLPQSPIEGSGFR